MSSISNFIWNIADSVLRDHYVRGKYRDVILPMTVIRRLDAVLAPTKDDVLTKNAEVEMLGFNDEARAQLLTQITGVSFFSTSPFTLARLAASDNPQRLRADFKAYLNGFSANVREHVLANFKFHNQIETLHEARILGAVIEKFVSPDINLGPDPVQDGDGDEIPGLDNHAIGSVFEDLVRRFNEENNEEAGEHWTPRDAEQIPLLHEGGIEGFLRREVLPYAPDAWHNSKSVKTGYEISFTRHFHKPAPMRPLETIRADILELERESEGLLAEIMG